MIHWRHHWSDWAVREKGAVYSTPGSYLGTYLIQERFCSTCGKVELNKQVVAENTLWDRQLIAETRTSALKKDGVA